MAHAAPSLLARIQAIESSKLFQTAVIAIIVLSAFVFLNMMVGTILEVMGSERQKRDAEQNQAAAEQAHDERGQMAAQISAMQQQLGEMHELLKSRSPGAVA
jgi:voltage-gated sodium channel